MFDLKLCPRPFKMNRDQGHLIIFDENLSNSYFRETCLNVIFFSSADQRECISNKFQRCSFSVNVIKIPCT